MKKQIALLLLLPILAGCSNETEMPSQSAKIVKAESLLSQEVAEGYDYIGIVKAKDTKNYSFLMSGKISEINVKKGQEIKAGDVLAKLDATTLDYSSSINSNNVTQAQANLEKTIDTYNTNITNAENNISVITANITAAEKGIAAMETGLSATETALNTAKTSLDTASKQLEAAKAVHSVGGMADLDLEAAQNQYDTKSAEYEGAKASYEGSKAELEKSKADLESLKTQKINAEKSLESLKVSKNKDVAALQATVNSAKASGGITDKNKADTVIKAEADGYVMELPFKEGEVISAGYPVVVAKSKELVVTVGATDSQYPNIKVGGTALIKGEAVGKVETIAQYPDEATRTYAVDIAVEGEYTIGESVDVKIVTGNTEGLFVPIDAVFNIEGVDYVYTVNDILMMPQLWL